MPLENGGSEGSLGAHWEVKFIITWTVKYPARLKLN